MLAGSVGEKESRTRGCDGVCWRLGTLTEYKQLNLGMRESGTWLALVLVPHGWFQGQKPRGMTTMIPRCVELSGSKWLGCLVSKTGLSNE